jgi:predicted SnoaL-like aldol condensation-catalyzing enzyme
MRRLICVIAGVLLLGQAAHAADTSQLETNKKNVMRFHDELLNHKNFEAAQKYLGSHFRQHNPTAADGPEGLSGFVRFLKQKYPNFHADIEKAFADGDYVILHVHAVFEPETPGVAIVDIFRLDAGKIVEHWDVIQNIPEKSENANGMF